MRHFPRTGQRVFAQWNHQPLLVASVVALLFAGACSVVAGTILGLTNFRDVGYPDSANLLRIREIVSSGHIYSPIDRPPYFVVVYGPLTYVLLAIPYALAQTARVDPQVAVRLSIVGAVAVSVLSVFLMSRRLHSSRPISWLCVLFAMSATPFANWTTQIRGDFLAVAFSLMGVYLVLRGTGRLPVVGAAVCAGIAVLVKQTFLAAPIAITCWLVYRRRFRDAAFFGIAFLVTAAGGYAFVLWREPLMLEHIAAIRRPIFEFPGALDILGKALSQPVVPFAALGGFLVLWRRTAEGLLVFIYCIVAWLVAILTIPQAGGNINYFWEPWLASAVLAGLGLYELQRKTKDAPVLVTAMLLLLLLRSFVPTLRADLRYLKQSYGSAITYSERKARWESLVATISGRRLLSTFPDVAVHASIPEIPDPFVNSTLELRGTWNSSPVADEIDASQYDLIIISKGMADEGRDRGYRGIRQWSDRLLSATRRAYRPVCTFDGMGMEVWLPYQGVAPILPDLLSIGCLPVANQAYSCSTPCR